MKKTTKTISKKIPRGLLATMKMAFNEIQAMILPRKVPKKRFRLNISVNIMTKKRHECPKIYLEYLLFMVSIIISLSRDGGYNEKTAKNHLQNVPPGYYGNYEDNVKWDPEDGLFVRNAFKKFPKILYFRQYDDSMETWIPKDTQNIHSSWWWWSNCFLEITAIMRKIWKSISKNEWQSSQTVKMVYK